MFEEDMETGLKTKQAADNQEQNSGKNSATKRRGKNQLDEERADAPATNIEE